MLLWQGEISISSIVLDIKTKSNSKALVGRWVLIFDCKGWCLRQDWDWGSSTCPYIGGTARLPGQWSSPSRTILECLQFLWQPASSYVLECQAEVMIFIYHHYTIYHHYLWGLHLGFPPIWKCFVSLQFSNKYDVWYPEIPPVKSPRTWLAIRVVVITWELWPSLL